MASVGVNWAGVVVTLSEAETKTLESVGQDINNISKALDGMIGSATVAGVPIGLVIKVLAAYILLFMSVVAMVDKGNGVQLTLPLLAINFGQYWLVIPTPVSGATGSITVRRSTGSDFGSGPGANQDWSHGPCSGSVGTFFADVTGDGKADVILVNRDTICVRRSTGNDFGAGMSANEDWSHGPCFGTRGTYFADVDGDGKAECILVNDDTICVRRSTGSDFGPGISANEDWSHGPCFGTRGTFFADVDGDGRADCILVNNDTICVRRSTGSDFGPGPGANEDWTHGASFGSLGTYFADVTGDGKADLILVNPNTISVRRSTGSDFGPGPGANEDWTHGASFGSLGTYFADVTGNGKADLILVNPNTICVRRSTGSDFGPGPGANEDWTHGAYYGNKGTFFSSVTGGKIAHAIVVNG